MPNITRTKEKEKITLKLTGYRVSGVAYVTTWYGEKATIEMEPYEIETDSFSEEEIREGINDNGFGVRSIDGADCWIAKVYGYYGYSYHYFYMPYLYMEFRNGKCVHQEELL